MRTWSLLSPVAWADRRTYAEPLARTMLWFPARTDTSSPASTMTLVLRQNGGGPTRAHVRLAAGLDHGLIARGHACRVGGAHVCRTAHRELPLARAYRNDVARREHRVELFLGEHVGRFHRLC